MQEVHYHSRLFVGEGDFSYTLSYIKKHPELASYITATEIYDNRELRQRGLRGRVQYLERKGVNIRLSVDATKLHEIFRNESFERIHWNLPWDGNPYQDQTLPELIHQFFCSSSCLQHHGDRIHITIPQPKRDGIWQYQQGYALGIVEASIVAGYVLVSKRFMMEDGHKSRYPYYETSHNYRNEVVASAEECSSEFVFQKNHDWRGPFDFYEAKRVYANDEIEIQPELFYADEECQKRGYYFDAETDFDSSEGFSEIECSESFSEEDCEFDSYGYSPEYSDEEHFE